MLSMSAASSCFTTVRRTYQVLLQSLERPIPDIRAYDVDKDVRRLLQTRSGTARESLLHPNYERHYIPDALDDECEVVPIVRHPDDPDRFGYWSGRRWSNPLQAQTRREWIGVDALEITRWQVNPEVFFETHRRALEIPDRCAAIERLPNLLWELGLARIGRVRHTVLFARAVRGERAAEVLRWVRGLNPATPMVLLTTSRKPDLVNLPAQLVWVTLEELVSGQTVFDTERLAQMLCQPGYVLPRQDGSPVQCAPDGSWLEIRGNRVSYRSKHRLLVRQLFEAWQRGDALGQRLKTSALLAHAGYASGTELSKVFHGKKEDWRSQIAYGQGECWLNL